jgi:methyl-accepting chemotaxis protein
LGKSDFSGVKEMARSNIFYDKYARTKRRLFILILVMTFVSLGAGLGILKLSNLKTVGMGLETIYHDRVQPLKQLKMLSDIYGITIVDTVNKVFNDAMSWEEGRKRLDQTTKRITGLWGEYLSTYLTEEERQAAKELQSLFETAARMMEQLGTILADKDRKALGELIEKDLYPTIEPVTQKIDELFQMQIRIVKDINDTEKVRYKLALTIGTGSIALSIILFFLAILQWRRFRSLLDSL